MNDKKITHLTGTFGLEQATEQPDSHHDHAEEESLVAKENLGQQVCNAALPLAIRVQALNDLTANDLAPDSKRKVFLQTALAIDHPVLDTNKLQQELDSLA